MRWTASAWWISVIAKLVNFRAGNGNAFSLRALAQEGKVILLDEPFTGVDVKTEDAIIQLLRDMRDEGRVMLVSTHNLGSVPEFCDRTVLVKGTVLAHGLIEDTFTQANLEVAFGGVLRHFVLGGKDLHDDDDNVPTNH